MLESDMSSEKDRRSTFGSRISSIFNTHPHISHAEPLKVYSQSSSGASLKLYKPALINKASNVSLKRNQEEHNVPELKNDHRSTPANTSRTITKSASPEIVRHTKQTSLPSELARKSTSPSLSPVTSASHMRRKPPPEVDDSSDCSSDNLYFNAPSPRRSPGPPGAVQNMDDIIGTIESEIGYMGIGDSEHNSMYEHEEYNTSALNTPNLPMPRSKPITTLADYNSDYSDSSQSMGLPVLEINNSVPPYPVDPFGDSSMDNSPVSPIFRNTSEFGSYSNDYPASRKDPVGPLSSSSSATEINNMNSSRRSSDTYGSVTPTRRSTLTLPIIIPENQTFNANVPLSKLSSSSLYTKNQSPFVNQSNRNSTGENVIDPIVRTKTSSTIPSTSSGMVANHRHSSSISSIWSSNSYRNVNLATIKKNLHLKPGEGESSNYVITIRRSAGTAFNESGPGKWKLPTGILPVDTSATYAKSNGRYTRLAGGLTRAKKTSGVELKHGHLQPRLLAAEIDDGESSSLGITPKISAAPSTKTNLSDIKSSSSSITAASTINISRNNSLARTTTEGSTLGTDLQSVVTESTNSGSRKSISSSSSGSISDSNVKIGGYYQHPGYKYEDDQGSDTGNEDDASALDYSNRQSIPIENDMDEYDERPRLVLANPDMDSDSD